MTVLRNRNASPERWIWLALFGLLALYVAARMEAFSLWVAVRTPTEMLHLPSTYATVDHPFHVARADMLWRALTSGDTLRWIAQHQGGYPVEFYPLGEAWLEVVLRALSLGTLAAEGAHTMAIIALFLLPGAAFVALARIDRFSPAVGLIALTFHVSLPGGWYDGGYTELVQWGLVTNVAAAVASFLVVPALIHFLQTGGRWMAGAATLLAAFAIYANPRSAVGLAAIGAGVWIAAILVARGPTLSIVSVRLAVVVGLAALMAAPELMALARFGNLYTFVRYSGYRGLGEYAATAAKGVTWPILALCLMGGCIAVRTRRLAATSVAIGLLCYVALTAILVVVPSASDLAPQLEPTRLMPLQRLLTFYLAAVASWSLLSALAQKIWPSRRSIAPVAAVAVALAILFVQTRPLAGQAPDPSSPAIAPAGLYPVAMSARPEQADLEAAVRLADQEADPGTALLVLGSALSWHQQLWAPLWTKRPLYYDNWLWYWRPDHAGTPGYVFLEGHHYPDPARTLDRDYLDRHGIGAVIVTGPVQDEAQRSPLLRPLRSGVYDAYAVVDPTTTVTYGDHNATSIDLSNQRVTAAGDVAEEPIVARINWHPRWEARVANSLVLIDRSSSGYLEIATGEPSENVDLLYSVQPLDWLARGLAILGVSGLGWLMFWKKRQHLQAGSRSAG